MTTRLPQQPARSYRAMMPVPGAAWRWLSAGAAWMCLATSVFGQQTPPAKQAKLPKEDVSLETKDHLLMKATFYPGSKGKETVPVILVHGYKGSRQDLSGLAKYLQSEEGGGCAVIVPDLRGHGDSLRFRGVDKALEIDRLPLPEFKKMFLFDMEAVKNFLLKKNNEGQLNIEKLCVVGCEMGALVAANWAKVDWSWPPLATGKQGQDVKALVLISPLDLFKGLRMIDALAHKDVKSRLSVLIAIGNDDSKAVKDANKIFDQFQRFHPEPAKVEDQDLDSFAAKTNLQGAKLVLNNSFGLQDAIAKFIERRLIKQSLPWQDRKNPLE